MTFQWQVWNELAVHFLNAGLDVACKSEVWIALTMAAFVRTVDEFDQANKCCVVLGGHFRIGEFKSSFPD